MVNLRNNLEYGDNLDSFFPRSYDLGNDAERSEFISDYEKTALFNLLKKSIHYFKMRKKELLKEIKKEIL